MLKKSLLILALAGYAFGDLESMTKLCDQGAVVACSEVGWTYGTGDGVQKDNFKAVNYFTKACDGGYAMACFNLGLMYYKGEGVRQDRDKALQLYGKSCDLEYEAGCKNYSILKGMR